MPVPPKDPNPVSSKGGDPIEGQDWNDLVDLLVDPTLGHDHQGTSTAGRKVLFKSLTQLQYGLDSVTINAGQNSATKTVTFPTAFSAAPRVMVVMRGAMGVHKLRRSFTMVSPDAIALPWAVPAAVTEFLGLQLHRIAFDTNVTVPTFRLHANIITPAPFGSVMRAEWSQDSGTTWNNLTPTIPIDAAQSPITGTYGSAAGTFNNGLIDTWVRLVASGGDGVTVAEFGNILLEYTSNISATFGFPSAETATQFTLNVRSVQPEGSATFNVVWLAWLP